MGALSSERPPANPTGHEHGSPRLPTIVQKLVGDVRVVVMGSRGARLEGEFDAHVAESVAMAPSVRVVLVVQLEADAGMDATERKSLFNAGLFNKPTAVLLDGTLGRLIFTAVRWMGAGNVHGFARHQLAQACDVLRIPGGQRALIASTIRELGAKLAMPTSAPGTTPSDVVQTADRVRDVVTQRAERMRVKSM